MDPIVIVILIVMAVVVFFGVVASKMRDLSQPPTARPLGQSDSRRIQEQIDEFLRRASQRSAGPPSAAKPPPPAPIAAEVVDDDQVGTGVAQQVQKYLDTSEFRRRSESMGEEVVQSDEQFTQQVRKSFSGDVGRLSTRRGESAAPPEVLEVETSEAENAARPTLDAQPAAGSGLADLLGSSDNIAHAVIMSEILRQPEW